MEFYNDTEKLTWNKVIPEEIGFKAAYKVLPAKGNMAWEYNPFRNLRLDEDKYQYNEKLYSKSEIEKLLGITLSSEKELPEGVTLYQSNELVDFITDQLSFDINHPVTITPSYSYDGSVDLILNDGKNQPRLINSRFSATGMNTYEVINRKGDNDTNIYDLGNQFDIDTSLYKKTNKIPKITFNGTKSGGDLKIGNYHFYFKYADADDNETDFVAESGLVSIFKGISSPYSINSGQKNENSLKCASFTVSNVDPGYQYLHVYYTRSTAEGNNNYVTNAVKINQKYLVQSSGICNILVTGSEESEDIPISDINLEYNVIQAAKSQAICQNMLFLANVQKAEIPYDELQDLSLRFLPYLYTKNYNVSLDESYSLSSTSKGYYDSKFIYNFTGYWNSDLYRLGIVYIMKDNTLSPVFNIRGRESVKSFNEYNHTDNVNSGAYCEFPLRDSENNRQYINYNESTYLLIKSGNTKHEEYTDDLGNYENVKGVVSLDSSLDTDTILGFDIRADQDTIEELKQYVKGFFFVRQRRMPMTLCQGITIGIEKSSRLPAIPTTNGVTDIDYTNTYVETSDKDPEEVHYILEGFMGRYTYKLKRKSAGFWSKIVSALKVAVVVAAAAAITYFSAGTLTSVVGATLAGVLGSTGFLIGSGIAVGSIIAVTATVSLGQQIVLSSQQARHKTSAAKPHYGRKASIPKGYKREETGDSRKLDAEFKQRIILADVKECDVSAMYVPEYTVNQGKYNQLFNGDEFTVEYANSQAVTNFSNIGYFQNNNGRHFYISGYKDYNNKDKKNYVNLQGIPEGVAIVGLKNQSFRSKAGDQSSATRFEQAKTIYKDNTLNSDSDLIRGIYTPYVAMTGFNGPAATTLNIKVPGYDKNQLLNYINIRMSDHTEYSAISDRFDIFEIGKTTKRLLQDSDNSYYFNTQCFRGDCYICQFTQRVNRNFNDDTSPYNDTIVDTKTWKNYDYDDATTLTKINVGDVNAVELGMWVTFRVRSNYNLNIRTEDGSQATEKAGCGHDRSYYPKQAMSTNGSYKIADSYVYNLGFSKSLSDRYYFELPDSPYNKNWYGTRIMYSDINITDGFQNGFRTFRGTTYRDYTREYGSIIKIVELSGYLLVVFEHGIGLIEVNEKAIAAQAATGNVYITTNNVLPDKVTILSDAIGSQWQDSILKVPVTAGSKTSVVFGVDTVAKKIWMCDGYKVTCISDFKVQEFLNNNITLGERDTDVILGVRNVKTLYNAFKQDVMFTFYDCLSGFEEKAWNLCYNLTLGKFITFYSWVPAFMENIDNIPFSFDRDVLKGISKLGISKSGNDFSDGIVLSNNIATDDWIIGELGLANRVLPFEQNSVKTKIVYQIVRDPYLNYKLFDIQKINGKDCLVFKDITEENTYNDTSQDTSTVNQYDDSGNLVDLTLKTTNKKHTVQELNAELYYRNIKGHSYSDWPSNSNIPGDCTNSELEWTSKLSTQSESEYAEQMQDKLQTSVEQQYPIFKDRSGRRMTLDEDDQINGNKIIRYINIRATIYISFGNNNSTLYDAYKSTYGDNEEADTDGYINCGYYESQVAITTEWNMQFLNSEFWKHGQAGLIDICDDIKPTVWYGKQHPFEFECVVVNDPGVQKIFHNLEILANKAEPESFHFEIVGESYDFAKDKVNMFFRQEAKRALLQYNGVDITYDSNFLKVTPRQQAKSADLVCRYYEREDKLQEIKDTYVGDARNKNYDAIDNYQYSSTYSNWASLISNEFTKHDYRHLSGSEIVYYKNRNEYRIWQHQPAINIDNLSQDMASSIIRGNCQYLEDRWRVSINPLLICYKNEYTRNVEGALCQPENSTWCKAKGRSTKLPPITIANTTWPDTIKETGKVDYPAEDGKDNALYGLYDGIWYDTTNWLDESSIYKTSFGSAQNRKETDLRDKFMKVRVRYSGKDLAVIDALLTYYSISYA